MMSVSYKSIKASENHGQSNARASPSCDAQMPRLPSVRNKQGLPSQRRAKEVSPSELESRNAECGIDDWKRKRSGGSDVQKESEDIVCSRDKMERE
ncbi:hypothetical protein M8J77_021048 [Diaphorina citri]|nr:hypothetical protein M8J77_021048 [Diaphorina citri]